MPLLKRFLRSLPLLLLSPFLVVLGAFALAAPDLLRRPGSSRPGGPTPSSAPAGTAPPVCASVVIPTWNGKDLLAKFLPSVVSALAANPANEIVVVDNGSTDGSPEFVRSAFPQVKLLALPANLGFGGGSNARFRAASNDIVFLLNNDMRVDAGFTDGSPEFVRSAFPQVKLLAL